MKEIRRVTRKEWEQAGKPAPEDFLKVGDIVPFSIVQDSISNGFLLDEDECKYAQDTAIDDVVGDTALYATFSRMTPGYPASPMRWKGLCEKNSVFNMHPKTALKNFIVSPCRATNEEDKEFSRKLLLAACRHYWDEGQMPIAPHLYFPVFLDDDDSFEREWGIAAGHLAMEQCDRVTVMVINGYISEGMNSDIQHAVNYIGIAPEYVRMDRDEAREFIKNELGEG